MIVSTPQTRYNIIAEELTSVLNVNSTKAVEIYEGLNKVMEQFEINRTSTRRNMFISQIAVESANFMSTREAGDKSYTAKRLRELSAQDKDGKRQVLCYGKMKYDVKGGYAGVTKSDRGFPCLEDVKEYEMFDTLSTRDKMNVFYAFKPGLGNTEENDGSRFMGRGLLQLTGRDNYTRFQRFLRKKAEFKHHNLLKNPELLEDGNLVFWSAGWFWNDKKLNKVVDEGGKNLIVEVSNRINGGNIGLKHRKECFEKMEVGLRHESNNPGAFVSLFHGSVKHFSQILKNGLQYDKLPVWVSRDIEAARNAISADRLNRELNPGDKLDFGIIESRIPVSDFESILRVNEKAYNGFHGADLKSHEVVLRSVEQIRLFNRYIKRQ